MRKYLKIFLAVALLAAPIPVLAFQLIPSGCTGQNVTTQNCGLTEIFQTFINFANFLLSIAGSVTLLMFIYGGFVWLTSGGASDKIKKGKDVMVNTAIGLVIMLAAATVIYSVGTFLCAGDQSCLRRLNIYGAAEGIEGGIDCRQQENDGKTCGTEKNYICSYELRKCVTRCEADQNLASQGYSCQIVPLEKKGKENASKYAESFNCRLNLCPGDWDNLCCPSGEIVTTCCKCTIDLPAPPTPTFGIPYPPDLNEPESYYLTGDSSTCIRTCESMASLKIGLAGTDYASISPMSVIEVVPGISPQDPAPDGPGCVSALKAVGL